MIPKYLFAVLVVVFVGSSCTYNSIEENRADPDLVIKTGTVCGWCTVNDTLTISGTQLRYVNYTNCSTSKTSVNKNGTLTSQELNTLLGLLNFDELKKLELNSCNVCVDGCDDWISFKNGSQTHYIRFGRNDPKLQPIKAFIDQLYAIKNQYSIP
jgi:hypothetical protein